MDHDTGTAAYRAEREALQAAGISDGLVDFIVEAFHDHDAAGRPPIVLTPVADLLCEHLARTSPPPASITEAAGLGEAAE